MGKKALLTSPERVKAFVGGISKGITFNSNPKLVYTELTADGQPDHPAWLFDINGKSGTYQMYIDIFRKEAAPALITVSDFPVVILNRFPWKTI